jgi:hypothetical protein
LVNGILRSTSLDEPTIWKANIVSQILFAHLLQNFPVAKGHYGNGYEILEDQKGRSIDYLYSWVVWPSIFSAKLKGKYFMAHQRFDGNLSAKRCVAVDYFLKIE